MAIDSSPARTLLPAATLTPITPTFGHSVAGIDLTVLSAQDIVDISDLIASRGVIHFKGPHGIDTIDKQIAFSKNFGELHKFPSVRAHDGYPDVLKLHADAQSEFSFGSGGWHADCTFEQLPVKYTLLRVTTTPPDGGGDTSFAFMPAVLSKLNPSLRAVFAQLQGFHPSRHVYDSDYGRAHRKEEDGPGGFPDAVKSPVYPSAVHPCVVTHPRSGLQALYVNSSFTTHLLGMSKFESRALLDLAELLTASSSECQLRVRWNEGDLTMWDNRLVQHTGNWDYKPHVRTAFRTTVVCRDKLVYDLEGKGRGEEAEL
ncbi:taurine catabolism dioxygenase [Gonapodya prolifera JEL478]|uniref:Taurine catabolism dioxygenase n=1 Tax=Gonapodya prolifera (strain JEL478) TaxID=1344416 RepID=A0A139A6D1_GONPJ|nr:taurine catabolism dioxygenase [Gonapodya prolifera JEL478]|eukprot:KXS11933.1 taurine catabolism dioxygenase [Gonapodya prolifera JEL478]